MIELNFAKSQYFNNYYMKKTRFWRGFALLTVIFCCVIIGFFSMNPSKHGGDHIAKIDIDGMIIDAGPQVKAIAALQDNQDVKAVIVAINSPGGTTYDSELIYNALRRVATKKPIVAYMKNVAASGGYAVALAAEKIFAAKTTITGSIGVVMQMPNAEKLLKNIGVSVLQVKSSPIKGEPNYYANPPAEALKNMQDMVQNTHEWFKDIVKSRRTQLKSLEAVTNGSVFTGQQAQKNGLIDAIGGQLEAKNYLIKQHKLDKDIEIVTVSLEEIEDDFQMNDVLKYIFSYFIADLQDFLPLQRNSIDGLLSLWHS